MRLTITQMNDGKTAKGDPCLECIGKDSGGISEKQNKT